MYNIRYLMLCLIVFNGCINNKTYDTEYKVFDYYESEDIGQLGGGFSPNTKYKSWYFLRSSFPSSGIKILFKPSGSEKVFEENIQELKEGYRRGGPVTDMYYYFLVIENGEQVYLTKKNEIIRFFGEIDTKEEALLLAFLEGFNIDTNNLKGSSYKKTKSGYNFLLMKGSDLPSKEYTQYKVSISKNGKLSWEKGEVYCKGMDECEGCSFK